jgi:uncharacterized protein (DUF433 family)
MRIDWHKFIFVDPEIHHGEPCIKGTRIPVSMIVGVWLMVCPLTRLLTPIHN